MIIRDDTAAILGTAILNLPAKGHQAFMLTDDKNGYPVSPGKRGSIEFDTPTGGQISTIGRRANPGANSANSFALTTVPPLDR